jgi:hypothetical protein
LLLKPELHHWFCRAVALVTIGYLVYQKFVAEPKQLEADEMFVAQENFQQATNGASDSLYKLSLNGSEGKFGFIKIADEYSGTDAELSELLCWNGILEHW